MPTEFELAKAEGRSLESAEELLEKIGLIAEAKTKNRNGQASHSPNTKFECALSGPAGAPFDFPRAQNKIQGNYQLMTPSGIKFNKP